MADAMQNVTVRLHEATIDTLDEEADERGISRSERIREALGQRHEIAELQQEVDRLQERLESREERIDELEEQLSRRSNIEEKVDTLAKRQEPSDAPFFVKWYHWFRNHK